MHPSFRSTFILAALILVGGITISGCGKLPTILPASTPTAAACPTTQPCPSTVKAPFEEAWAISAHAAKNPQAIPDWNNPSKRVVDAACAGCHTADGFNQLLTVGAASASPFPATSGGESLACETCHQPAAQALTQVLFPSGKKITASGKDAVCLVCHQGTGSTEAVNQALQDANEGDEDAPLDAASGLTWVDSHSGAAAAVLMGSSAHAGYEYPGKTYTPALDHPGGDGTCTSCHDAHSNQVRVDRCQVCHLQVNQPQDARAIRMAGSNADYDGDGDTSEGLAYEIETLRGMLYQAIQGYARQISAAPIVYDQGTYPYFFVDLNENGKTDPDETQTGNRYTSWTPRLFKAAYNYRFASIDAGGYAHNGPYLLELLYDSIEDLNQKIADPINLARAARVSEGHFDGADAAFRQWDKIGTVPAACSHCHTSAGAAQYVVDEVSTSQPAAAGLECTVCHTDLRTFGLRSQGMVLFPGGVRLGLENDPTSNLCLSCHTGETTAIDVTDTIGKTRPDEPSNKMDLPLQHPGAAASILFGSQVHSLYEYPGQKYSEIFYHPGGGNSCLSCHDAHTLKVDGSQCIRCHGVSDPQKVRWVNGTKDFNGNGDLNEGLAQEIGTMKQQLYADIQWYAGIYMDNPIAYAPTSPYFYNDRNDNGSADPEEVNPENAYNVWTPRLLRAAYNYQAISSDPGAYAHNGKYVLQVLFDAILDLRGSVKGLLRPTP